MSIIHCINYLALARCFTWEDPLLPQWTFDWCNGFFQYSIQKACQIAVKLKNSFFLHSFFHHRYVLSIDHSFSFDNISFSLTFILTITMVRYFSFKSMCNSLTAIFLPNRLRKRSSPQSSEDVFHTFCLSACSLFRFSLFGTPKSLYSHMKC